MNIVVCIKQVPETSSVHINPETNTLVREGVESIINPYDEFALEVALELKERDGSRVTALCMGPAQAESALRGALARGVDEAILLSGREFAGSDTGATSYALAGGIRKMGHPPDLVLFGKQAVDGDTAQVGPGVSEFLGMPVVVNAVALRVAGGALVAETLGDEGVDVIEGSLPVVVTVAKGGAAPRFATLGGRLHAESAVVPVWGAGDIGADPALTGLEGSPARVKRGFPPTARAGGRRIDARGNSEEAVNAILETLKMVKEG